MDPARLLFESLGFESLRFESRFARTGLLAAALSCGALLARGGQGEPIRLEAGSPHKPLVKAVPGVGARFGTALAASDYRILVGAPHDREQGWRAGAAWVFDRVGTVWLRDARLAPGAGGPWQRFGAAVALAPDGALAVLGAPLADGAVPTSGAAWLFERAVTGWVERARIFPATGAANDGFGSALALEGARLAVGAPYADRGAFLSGAVTVFELTQGTWLERAELAAPDPSFFAGFGSAVAFRGVRLLVGAPRADAAGADAGAAYLFEHDGTRWQLVLQLLPPPGSGSAAFGHAVALGAGHALVGAPGAHAAYVFEPRGGTWVLASRLPSPGLGPESLFGTALAERAGAVLVGAPGEPPHGAVLHLRRTAAGWAFVERLEPPDAAPAAAFGASVTWSRGDRIAGAPADSPPDREGRHSGEPGSAWVW